MSSVTMPRELAEKAHSALLTVSYRSDELAGETDSLELARMALADSRLHAAAARELALFLGNHE